jgi:hypothetical protein
MTKFIFIAVYSLQICIGTIFFSDPVFFLVLLIIQGILLLNFYKYLKKMDFKVIWFRAAAEDPSEIRHIAAFCIALMFSVFFLSSIFQW